MSRLAGFGLRRAAKSVVKGAAKTTNDKDIVTMLREKRLLVVCGSGGVGKTTTSAAMACAAAQAGRKVLVLTIDPARRLASSLGLSELDNDPRRVAPELFAAQGLPMKGELWAMMLDTKHTFDQVVARYSPRPEVAERILNNVIYQQISDALAGTQEYMAMEQLYELTRRNEFDLIVLDTPPTQHALDFLDSPDRMIGVLDSGVVKKVFGGAMKAGKTYLSWLRRSTKLVASLFERITGGELFTDMADFFQSFDELYDGISGRSKAVKQLLQSKDTLFLLVTSPSPSHMQEANYFLSKIDGYGVKLGGFIVNRVHRLADGSVPSADALPRVADVVDCLRAGNKTFSNGSNLEPLVAELLLAWTRYSALAQQDRLQIKQLQARAKVWVRQIPYFEADIHDLKGLDRINRHLMNC